MNSTIEIEVTIVFVQLFLFYTHGYTKFIVLVTVNSS